MRTLITTLVVAFPVLLPLTGYSGGKGELPLVFEEDFSKGADQWQRRRSQRDGAGEARTDQ